VSVRPLRPSVHEVCKSVDASTNGVIMLSNSLHGVVRGGAGARHHHRSQAEYQQYGVRGGRYNSSGCVDLAATVDKNAHGESRLLRSISSAERAPESLSNAAR
jgi:hypothetical protein